MDFIIIGGDLTVNGSDEELQWHREPIATSRMPVYSVIGGHDGNEVRRGGATDPTGNCKLLIGQPLHQQLV